MPLLLPPSPSIASNKLKLSTLTFVTSNADKIREVTSICKDYGITVNIRSIDLPELQGSIEEVAREKCRQAALAVCPCFAISRRVNLVANDNMLME
jgi:inosine triphosphate pyrophosphatase